MNAMEEVQQKNAETMAALNAMADYVIDRQGFIGWQDNETGGRMFLVQVYNPFAFAQAVYDAVVGHEQDKCESIRKQRDRLSQALDLLGNRTDERY